MQTNIIISGQIGGNFTLRSALMSSNCEESNTMFNGVRLTYPSKKAAIKAIREAYNLLGDNEPEYKGKFGGVRASSDRTALYYDASKAVIE